MQQYVERYAHEYEILEQELTLLLYALDRAMMHEGLQAYMVPLICTAAPFLLLRGFYQETERFLERAYGLATASRNRKNMATVLLYLGDISHKRGDFLRAKEMYNHAKGEAEALTNVALMGIALHALGRTAWKLGDYDEAETILKEGLALARETEQPELIRDMHKTLAALYSNRADFPQAQSHAREGLAIARRLADRKEIVVLLINLGCSLQATPEKPASFLEALRIALEIKSDEMACNALINLGDWYIQIRDFPQAETHLRQAVTIARRLGHTEWTCAAPAILTSVLREEECLDEAETCIQEALILAKKIERPRAICIALDEIGRLALRRGNAESALLTFQEMLSLCPVGDAEVQAVALYGLGRAYEQLQHPDEALSYGKQALELLQEKQVIQYLTEVQQWYAKLQKRLKKKTPRVSGLSCLSCGNPIIQSRMGRTKYYCNDTCRKRAQRKHDH